MDISSIESIISSFNFEDIRNHISILRGLYLTLYQHYNIILKHYQIIDKSYYSAITNFFHNRFTDININVQLFKQFFNNIKEEIITYNNHFNRIMIVDSPRYSLKEIDEFNILLFLCIKSINKKLEEIKDYCIKLLNDEQTDELNNSLEIIISNCDKFNNDFFDCQLFLFFNKDRIDYFKSYYDNKLKSYY